MRTASWCLGVIVNYHQASNISRTLIGYEIVHHSDVVGASPAGAAPTASSDSRLNAWLQWIGQQNNCKTRRESFIFFLFYAAYIRDFTVFHFQLDGPDEYLDENYGEAGEGNGSYNGEPVIPGLPPRFYQNAKQFQQDSDSSDSDADSSEDEDDLLLVESETIRDTSTMFGQAFTMATVSESQSLSNPDNREQVKNAAKIVDKVTKVPLSTCWHRFTQVSGSNAPRNVVGPLRRPSPLKLSGGWWAQKFSRRFQVSWEWFSNLASDWLTHTAACQSETTLTNPW